MAGKKITDRVEELLSGFFHENGYELYKSEFVKEGRRLVSPNIYR